MRLVILGLDDKHGRLDGWMNLFSSGNCFVLLVLGRLLVCIMSNSGKNIRGSFVFVESVY
jgi:hypothetical protein